MNNPFVSIITPNFNKSKFIVETLTSVINQTYKNWELLIIDDFSTDNSISIIQNFSKKDARIKVILNNENQGANICRNQGLNIANGAFILFLDADDLISPRCIERRLKMFTKETNAVVFPMGIFKNEIGDFNTSYNWIPKEENALNNFLSHDLPWSIVQPLWRTSVLKELNGFDTSYSRLQDVDLHTRALLRFDNIKCFPNETADCYYRIDEDRHAFSKFNFFTKWVDSAIKFYHNFENKDVINIKNLLAGTILATLAQLLNAYNLNQLTKKETKSLKDNLVKVNLLTRSRFILNGYFFIQLNLKKRIPGLRWLTNKLISI